MGSAMLSFVLLRPVPDSRRKPKPEFKVQLGFDVT